MSVGQVNANANVIDLLSPKTGAGEPRLNAGRADGAGQKNDGGFEQVLRDSTSKKRSQSADAVEPRDTGARSEQDGVRQSSEGEQATDKPAEKASTDQAQDKPDQPESTGEEVKQAESSDTAEAEQGGSIAQDAALNAQALASQSAAGVGMVQGPAQQAVNEKSAELEAQAQASGAKQQAQAALQHAAGKAQQGSATTANTQAQTAVTAAAQSIQPQNAESETGGEQAKGESSSAAPLNATTAQAGNSTANSAAFTLPDAQAGESRLPVSPAGNTPQQVAANAAQAQPIGVQDDADAVNTARLTRGLANAVQQRGGAITLRLTPPEMGTVRIQMQITGTNVIASFHAESASAQTLLTQQLSQLRSALENHGMNVEKLSVQPMASTAQSQNASQNQNDNQQQQNQAQQQSANDGRSRGQYSGDSSGGRQGRDAPASQHQPRGFVDQLTDAGQTAAA